MKSAGVRSPPVTMSAARDIFMPMGMPPVGRRTRSAKLRKSPGVVRSVKEGGETDHRHGHGAIVEALKDCQAVACHLG